MIRPYLALKVTTAMPVFKGDMVRQELKDHQGYPAGFGLVEVEQDGIYLGPTVPIIPLDEALMICQDIIKERRRVEKQNDRIVRKMVRQELPKNVLPFSSPPPVGPEDFGGSDFDEGFESGWERQQRESGLR